MNIKDQIKQLFLRETEMLQRTQHNGVSIFYREVWESGARESKKGREG